MYKIILHPCSIEQSYAEKHEITHFWPWSCTWISGQEGLFRWISEFAARAPLKKVGPRFIVMLENLEKQAMLFAAPEKNLPSLFLSFEESVFFLEFYNFEKHFKWAAKRFINSFWDETFCMHENLHNFQTL